MVSFGSLFACSLQVQEKENCNHSSVLQRRPCSAEILMNSLMNSYIKKCMKMIGVQLHSVFLLFTLHCHYSAERLGSVKTY